MVTDVTYIKTLLNYVQTFFYCILISSVINKILIYDSNDIENLYLFNLFYYLYTLNILELSKKSLCFKLYRMQTELKFVLLLYLNLSFISHSLVHNLKIMHLTGLTFYFKLYLNCGNVKY